MEIIFPKSSLREIKKGEKYIYDKLHSDPPAEVRVSPLLTFNFINQVAGHASSLISVPFLDMEYGSITWNLYQLKYFSWVDIIKPRFLRLIGVRLGIDFVAAPSDVST